MILIRIREQLQFASGPSYLDVDCEWNEGGITAIYGPSGAGKTTILRILAGLKHPANGLIRAFGATWTDTEAGERSPPQKRSVGVVFQEQALFPNMTVRGNLEYALARGDGSSIVDELIEVTELKELQGRYPDGLSGGQRQRVALARALVRRPRLLLLDEPLSALDTAMRVKLQSLIVDLHTRYQLTTVLVSHDVGEIVRMAGHVIMLDEGRVVRQGSTTDVFACKAPDARFRFTGEVMSINNDGTRTMIVILTEGEQVAIELPHALPDLHIGDVVLVAATDYLPAVTRINA
jgi:molybdate transport system ATP-binding protein